MLAAEVQQILRSWKNNQTIDTKGEGLNPTNIGTTRK
jgi:hypothetical protein